MEYHLLPKRINALRGNIERMQYDLGLVSVRADAEVNIQGYNNYILVCPKSFANFLKEEISRQTLLVEELEEVHETITKVSKGLLEDK